MPVGDPLGYLKPNRRQPRRSRMQSRRSAAPKRIGWNSPTPPPLREMQRQALQRGIESVQPRRPPASPARQPGPIYSNQGPNTVTVAGVDRPPLPPSHINHRADLDRKVAQRIAALQAQIERDRVEREGIYTDRGLSGTVATTPSLAQQLRLRRRRRR